MQAAACPGGVERGPLRGTGDFPGPGLPFAPRDPTDVREGTSCRLLARAFSEIQAPAGPGGVERGPLRGTGDFPGKLGGFPRRGRSLWCEAWRGDSRSLRGVAADGGPRVRINLPPPERWYGAGGEEMAPSSLQ